ncbi:MAG: inorganic phosphate transporter [Chitinophagales bacterium]|nr:inorganic phosphate transporter [Chitinophagales bacterium]
MTFLIIIIVVAILFDFINGFHDSANSIATIVSTRVLTPFQAVAWAAFFNFLAFFFFVDHGVADTIKKMVHEDAVTETVLFGGLVGAIIWNLLTWWWGIPSSSSHALLGGFTGAAFAKAGIGAINMDKLSTTLLFIPLAPIIGMVSSYAIALLVLNLTKKLPASKVDKYFRRLQLVSSALFSLGHGGNDAQKTMGIIWAALAFHGYVHPGDTLPSWVALACYTAMGMGTLFGGWRIVKTMGQKLAKLKPFEGFCAETAGALTLFAVTGMKIPVSTTHTITGSIMGTGMTKRLSAVRWGVAGNIVFAWIVTIPASALMGAVTFWVLHFFGM